MLIFLFVKGIWALIQYIKMSSYQYRKSHCGDKTIWRLPYLHNEISYAGKTPSLYWIRALMWLHNVCLVYMNHKIMIYSISIWWYPKSCLSGITYFHTFNVALLTYNTSQETYTWSALCYVMSWLSTGQFPHILQECFTFYGTIMGPVKQPSVWVNIIKN